MERKKSPQLRNVNLKQKINLDSHKNQVAEQSFYHAKQMGADDYLDFISFFQREMQKETNIFKKF